MRARIVVPGLVVALLAVESAVGARAPAAGEKRAIARAVAAFCATGDGCGNGKSAGKILVSTENPRWAAARVGTLQDGCAVVVRRVGDAWKPLACGIDWGEYALDYAAGPPPGNEVPEDVISDLANILDP